jgi:hypothetical protein
MAINYTTLLGLAQPVTGTEANTWGDVVNDEITALLDSAIAGTATISVTAGDVTLTSVDGAADQARMAILVATGTPGVARNIIAPAQSKSYIVVNQSDSSVILKGSATTGVAVRAGQAATCVWNGTDFEIAASGDVDGPASATDNAIARYDGTTGKLIQNSSVTIDDSNNVSGVVQLNATTVAATTGNITTVNATTVDTTNIEVTNIKAKDGTASTTIADATGVVTISTQLNVDNLRLDGNTVSSTDTNGNVNITPAGSGAMIVGGNASFSSTGSVKIPVGTTAQRPSPVAGMLRFNDDSDEFEGYNGTAWASVGGSAISNDTSTATDLFPSFLNATTGTAASIFTSNAKLLYKPSTGEFKAQELVATNGIVVNSATISANYTIPTGSNAMSAGPVSISDGVSVTVSDGSIWVVV